MVLSWYREHDTSAKENAPIAHATEVSLFIVEFLALYNESTARFQLLKVPIYALLII
ncbi:hypothetical protein FLA_5996 [Filimonas lacunae]|nr:hypothetical protein FLA_5996 [Filimonas lacunae]